MLDLYVQENCPYCKKVLDYLEKHKIKFHKFDTTNKDNILRLLTIGGKDQVPFLHNKDTNEKLYESESIVNYLEQFRQD